MNQEKKVFYQKLVSLVLPIAFQNFMVALVGASDTLMLGRLDQNSMSSVSLAGQVLFVTHLFISSMSLGESIFVAQYYGKKDMKTIEKFLGITMRPTVLFSFIISLLALVCPSLLMRVWTSDPELIRLGSIYLRWVSPNYLLLGITEIFLCSLKNTDHAKKSSLISSLAVVVNIILNAIFIFGLLGFPAMGIAGAALATVLARLVSLIVVLPDFVTKKARIRFRLEHMLHVNPVLRKDFWKYVTPVVANMYIWGLGFSMGTVIMGRLGQDAVAANSVAVMAKNLAFCLGQGIGAGAGIMVGHELGAGELERAKLYGHKLCIMANIFGLLTALILIACIPLTYHVTDLSETAAHYLPWMVAICGLNMFG